MLLGLLRALFLIVMAGLNSMLVSAWGRRDFGQRGRRRRLVEVVP